VYLRKPGVSPVSQKRSSLVKNAGAVIRRSSTSPSAQI
jgi:hypothetical protein